MFKTKFFLDVLKTNFLKRSDLTGLNKYGGKETKQLARDNFHTNRKGFEKERMATKPSIYLHFGIHPCLHEIQK